MVADAAARIPLLLALLLAAPSSAAPAPDARCASEQQRGFEGSFAAEARNAEACLRDPGGLAHEACLDADRGGQVERAREHALAAEARACEESPGSGGAAAGNAAAARLARDLLRGLLGRDGPTPAAGSAGRCQQRVLREANACAAAYRSGGPPRPAATLRERALPGLRR